jgi:hypothetical protein
MTVLIVLGLLVLALFVASSAGSKETLRTTQKVRATNKRRVSKTRNRR